MKHNKQTNSSRRDMSAQKTNTEVLSTSAPTHRNDFKTANGTLNGRNIERRGAVPLSTNMYAYPTQMQPVQYVYPTVTQNLAQANALSSSDNYAYQCSMAAANYNAAIRPINYPNMVSMVTVPQHNSSVYVYPAQQQQYFQIAYPQPYVYLQTSIFEQRNYNLLKQIEFYFSPINLKKDIFIRRKMNCEGFIPLILVSGFPRVQAITNDLFLIGQVLQRSTEVELSSDGLQVRPKKDWKQWPLPPNTTELIKCV